MKCIKHKGKIDRVEDKVAHDLVKRKKATYVPKNLWKKVVRDA